MHELDIIQTYRVLYQPKESSRVIKTFPTWETRQLYGKLGYSRVPLVPTTKFLQVDMRGEYAGKSVQSTLWYKTDNVGGLSAVDLSLDLHAELTFSLDTFWCAVLPTAYSIVNRVFSVFGFTWLAELATPLITSASQPGALTRNTAGRGQTIKFDFNLNLDTLDPQYRGKVPRHTRIGHGPIGETSVGNDNTLITSDFPAGSLGNLAIVLATPKTGASLNVYYPIRVSTASPLGARDSAEIETVDIGSKCGRQKSRDKGGA